jgi:GTP-binding protein LepA
VPVLNKIDLPAAEPERVKQQIEDVIGLDASDAVPISAKTGIGIPTVLEAIVTRLPPPKGDAQRAAEGDAGRQLVRRLSRRRRLVRVIDGVLKKGQRSDDGTDAPSTGRRVGVFTPARWSDVDELGPGEVGFITASIKEVADTRVGDTITDERKPDRRGAARLQAGAAGRVLRPLPVDAADFEDLRAAMGKLRLNDASFSYEMETRPRSASASAAASSACCTSKSSRSAGARVRPRPDRHRAVGRLQAAHARRLVIELHNPADMPDVMKILTSRSRGSRPRS